MSGLEINLKIEIILSHAENESNLLSIPSVIKKIAKSHFCIDG